MNRIIKSKITAIVLTIAMMVSLMPAMTLTASAATPNDENYDDDAGYSNATTQFTNDGIKYTLTGPGPDTLVTNVAPSGWGELGDGGSDNFISIMGIDTLKIQAADGSYFKLNDFEMGFCSVAGVTITPETGSAITRARAGDESYYSIDVSANTDFQYIRYFTISGTDMIMNIDDLDFSPAVPPTHTVTYNGVGNTGGSAPTDGSSPYTEGDTVTVLGNSGILVKTGYSFAGWNTAANGSGTDYAQASTFAMGTSNVTLYAKWAPLYTVTYNGNSNTGGSVPTDGNSYLSGSTVTVLGNTGTLVKTGYSFAGWNTAANGSGTSRAPAATFGMGGSNVNLYAQWTPIDYTVTYNGNTNTGGAVPTDATAYHITDTVTVLGNTGTLVKTGYTFSGWNTAANGSGDSYSGGNTFAMGSSSVTLYAQWTENVYSVTYNGNGNNGGAVATDATSYHNGNTATVLGNTGTLVRTGYTFAGWNTAAGGGGTSYSGGDTFAIGLSNVTLYAQWTPIDYTVTYNGNTSTGGAVPTDGNTYHITDTITVKANIGTLVKTGYTFAGWNTAANGSGDSYSGGNTFAMGSSSVTLYAQWTENTYSVTYNGNGNTGGAVPTDATSYHITDTATVLGNTGTLVRTGYTFAGWNTAAGGGGTSYTGGDTFAIVSSDVMLYAQWTNNDYTVTYNGNTNTGGAVPTDGNAYHITDTVTVLGNTGTLTKTGYVFTGWNTAANGSGISYSGGGTFAMGGSNVTLFAQWAQTYTVTYDGNTNTGGSVPTDSGEYENGDTVTVIDNTGTLAKTGYTFAGWNTAANGSGTSRAPAATFAMGGSNVTLYAQWTPIDYSVTYNGNTSTGGAVPTDATDYHITDTVTVLGNTGTLVKTGYTFAGWNTASNGSGSSYSGGNTFAMGSSSVNLYAQWTANPYTVTYSGNGSTGGIAPADGATYHITDTVTVLGNTGTLAKTSYAFAGWNTAPDGSGTTYSAGNTFAMGSGNVILYAKWTSSGSTTTNTISTVVEINGQKQDAGTSSTATSGGQTTTTIKVDETKLDKLLESIGAASTVTLPGGTGSDVVVGELNGQTVKNMENKEAILEIKTDSVTYTLPASQINIDSVSSQIGSQVALKDIKVSVKIAEPSAYTVKVVQDTANKNSYKLVVKPVEFTITCTSGDKTVDVSKFNGYVERTVAIPDGADPSKITTGIVLNSDGTFSHVPTTIIVINGKYYAKISSLTNSTYSVIYNPVTFADVANHWANTAINDMGSRMVVTGVGSSTYEPDRSITRAEFAAIVVRALGLQQGKTESRFGDVSLSDWFNGYVDTATAYSLINGYDSATYGANDTITREQAMAILARAMKLTELSVSLTDREVSALLANYTDGASVSSYAKEAAAACLKTGVITGTTANTISPKAYVTRAEVAVMVQRLLQKSGLI